ncbi:MAG TPA: helix-turn-helix domain-containing protein, partial [Bryobacteraceae bacterium]
QFNRRFGRDAAPLSQETVHLLQQRDWPGNVRELENSIARYVVLGSEETFYGDQVDRHPGHNVYEPNAEGHIPLKRIARQAIRRMEHDVILRVLQANHWNRRKTAQVLKISYRALLYKVRQAGLPAKHPRQKGPDLEL